MARYLADTSAWNRSGRNLRTALRWSDLLAGRELGMCVPVALELLYSARSPTEYARRAFELSRLPQLPLDAQASSAAARTQALLASKSQHRSAAPADLLIAAIAEANGATLLHYDRHFDAIVRVTGQLAEWIAPRGSLD